MFIRPIAAAVLLACAGCGNGQLEKEQPLTKRYATRDQAYEFESRVIVIDGCEYVVVNRYNAISIVHKANCKNCSAMEKRQ